MCAYFAILAGTVQFLCSLSANADNFNTSFQLRRNSDAGVFKSRAV